MLRDPAVAGVGRAGRPTYRQAEEDIRAATRARAALLARSLELDADALVVRATVLTYQWIDELRDAATPTSARSPAVRSATWPLGRARRRDRRGRADRDRRPRPRRRRRLPQRARGDQPRADGPRHQWWRGAAGQPADAGVLTAGVLSGDPGRQVARGGLRALGVDAMRHDSSAAVRDTRRAAHGRAGPQAARAAEMSRPAPRNVADLMRVLHELDRPVSSSAPHRVATSPSSANPLAARATGGATAGRRRPRRTRRDRSPWRSRPRSRASDAHLLPSAPEPAARSRPSSPPARRSWGPPPSPSTAWSPRVRRRPTCRGCRAVRMLAFEDRADPVALLGSLVTAGDRNGPRWSSTPPAPAPRGSTSPAAGPPTRPAPRAGRRDPAAARPRVPGATTARGCRARTPRAG